MNKNQFTVLTILAALVAVGMIAGAKSRTPERELCRRAAVERLDAALKDPNITNEQWAEMLITEAKFLALVAKV